MFEQHHIVVANGVETESFHPAAAALDAIDEDQRLRLFDVMLFEHQVVISDGLCGQIAGDLSAIDQVTCRDQHFFLAP
ncbi:MAG: hypothetical protein AAFY31_13225 [Pseudomonadota bacterium]